MKTFLVGGTIYTPDKVIERGMVVIEGSRILEIDEARLLPDEGERIDVSGLKVVPGLIDLHIHGVKGADTMEGRAEAMARQVVSCGVTAFLATTMTASLEELKEALRNLGACQVSGGAELLGIHLEGPYLSPQQPGMMDTSLLRPFDWAELQGLMEVGQGRVKMVTLAPELEGALAGIRCLEKEGVVASLGHSNATFAEVEAAVSAGLRHATHVFNALRGFHHREPGAVGAVLHFPQIVAQMIVDGQHLHPATIELLLEVKGVDGVALISDATPLAGLPPGEYDWRGTAIEVKEGRAQVKDSLTRSNQQPAGASSPSLGGSVRMMNYGLKLLAKGLGLPLERALRTATTTPARALGLAHRKGQLAPGWDADIAAFDDDFECRLAMVGGQVVYRATRT